MMAAEEGGFFRMFLGGERGKSLPLDSCKYLKIGQEKGSTRDRRPACRSEAEAAGGPRAGVQEGGCRIRHPQVAYKFPVKYIRSEYCLSISSPCQSARCDNVTMFFIKVVHIRYRVYF